MIENNDKFLIDFYNKMTGQNVLELNQIPVEPLELLLLCDVKLIKNAFAKKMIIEGAKNPKIKRALKITESEVYYLRNGKRKTAD